MQSTAHRPRARECHRRRAPHSSRGNPTNHDVDLGLIDMRGRVYDPLAGQPNHEFKNWLSDWRSTADAGVRRRDYRISLGISQRRVRTSADSAEPATADDSGADEPAQP